jgi:hypothetical protein
MRRVILLALLARLCRLVLWQAQSSSINVPIPWATRSFSGITLSNVRQINWRKHRDPLAMESNVSRRIPAAPEQLEV